MCKIFKIIPLISMFLLTSCNENTTKKYIREYKYATIGYSIDKGEENYIYSKSSTLEDNLFKETSKFLHNFLNNDKNCLNYVSAGAKNINLYTLTFYYDVFSDGYNYEYRDLIMISKSDYKIIGMIHDYTNYDYASNTKNLTGDTLKEASSLIENYDKILEKLEWNKTEWSC